MWARHLELSLGLWLAVSPFVFGHAPGATHLWVNDLVCAGSIVLLALLPHWRPLRRIHLLELVVAAWLVGFGRVALSDPAAGAAAENHVVVGLLIGLLAVVPSEASIPPPAWRGDAAGGNTPLNPRDRGVRP